MQQTIILSLLFIEKYLLDINRLGLLLKQSN